MDRITPTPEGAKIVIGRIRNIADDVWSDPDGTAARVWQLLNPLVRGCKNTIAKADYYAMEDVPVRQDADRIIAILFQEAREIHEVERSEERKDPERAAHLRAIADSISEAAREIMADRDARFGEEVVPDYV